MTNEEKIQMAREAIASKFFVQDVRRFQGPKVGEWVEPYNPKEEWYAQYLRWADEVLSLEYPSGKPMLAILDEEQERPPLFPPISGIPATVQSEIVQNNMINNGWRKTLEMPTNSRPVLEEK